MYLKFESKCVFIVVYFLVSLVGGVNWCWRTKACNYDCTQRYYRSDSESDCDRYYLCINGVKRKNMRCPKGLVFSAGTKACVRPNSFRDDCPYSNNNGINRQPVGGSPSRPRPRPPDVSQSCGIKSSPNIVGGRNAHEGEWSWQVSLQYRTRSSGESSHICGAVLVSDRWVATAAHCVIRRFSGMMRAVIGAHNLRNPSRFQMKVGIQSIHMHPKYQNMGSYPNDIALVKLADPVDLSGGMVRPICLPKPYQDIPDESWKSSESGCWVTGWGRTAKEPRSDILQEVRIGIVDNARCAKLWRGYVNSNHVCVGMGDKGACRGDSGGPMVCSMDGRYYLTGITSWGEETCRDYGYPNIFTKVSNYVKWMRDIMDRN